MKQLLIVLIAVAPLTGCVLLESPQQTFDRLSKASDANAAKTVADDPSPQNRARAARDLGGKRDATSIELLRKTLRDSDPSVREAAAQALRETGDAAATASTDVMQALLSETNPAAAVAMGWALNGWKTDLAPAAESLKRALAQKDDPLARYHAALLLRKHATVELLAPVYVDTLETKVAQDARNKPDELLADLIPKNSATILPLLLDAAKSDNPAVRVAIARLLHNFKPEISPSEKVRRMIANPNAPEPDSTLPPDAEKLLLALLKDPDGTVREAAAWAARMCVPTPTSTGPLLLAGLADPVEAVRTESAHALAWLITMNRAPNGALAAVANLLNDPSAKVRAEGAFALSQSGALPADITKSLASRADATQETDAEVRSNAALALGLGANIPERDAALHRGLTDRNEGVVHRSLASIGLTGHADDRTLNIIAQLTAPPHPLGTRLNALGALNSIGPKAKSARPAVLAAAADPNPDIQEMAKRALQRLDE